MRTHATAATEEEGGDGRDWQARFNLLAALCPGAAVLTLDPGGRIEGWDGPAERLFGRSAGEATGQHLSMLYCDEEAAAGRPVEDVRRALEQGVHRVERRWARRDGAEVVVDVLMSARALPRGLAVAVRVRPELDARLGEMLATLCHELRTPLTSILAWTQMLRARSDDSYCLRGLDVIERNARAEARLLDELVDLVRLSTGRLRLDLAPLDLRDVVDAALEIARPEADSKGLRLVLDCPAPARLRAGDGARLQQAVVRLLRHGIEVATRAGVLTVSLRAAAHEARLRIASPGALPAEVAAALGDGELAGLRPVERRVGLGLWFCRRLAELHGGRLELAVGPELGAALELVLPGAAAEP